MCDDVCRFEFASLATPLLSPILFLFTPLILSRAPFLCRAESSSSDIYLGGDSSDDCVMCDGSRVYTLRAPWHIVCLVLNILLPGWGTMVSASACVHATRDEKRSACSCGTFADGLFQFYTFPLLFGWVWSIYIGVALYRKGRDF